MFRGEMRSRTEIAKMLGIALSTLSHRLNKKGESLEFIERNIRRKHAPVDWTVRFRHKGKYHKIKKTLNEWAIYLEAPENSIWGYCKTRRDSGMPVQDAVNATIEHFRNRQLANHRAMKKCG